MSVRHATGARKGMNVLFLNSIAAAKYGGGEKWMVNTAWGLAQRGHRIRVVARPESRFLTIASRRGLETESLRFRGDFGPFVIRRLAQLIRRGRVDLVCTNFDKELRLCGFASMLAGERPKFVARKGLPLIMDKLSHRLTYCFWVDAVITPSQGIKRRFSDIPWLKPDIVHVIPNGVDFSHHACIGKGRFREECGLDESHLLVGFVGRLEEQKGCLYLLDAVSRLRDRHPQAYFVFVGDGPDREILTVRTEHMRLADRVRFTGFREDIPEILADLDILVLPSLFEGLPNVLLEAMAQGVPVVATKIDGVAEIVRNERLGVTVPVKDTEALAWGIAALLGSEERRMRTGRLARKFVCENYSMERMIDGVEALFQCLTADHR